MVNLYIQGELLDQYADESVDIHSSVLDVQDITKNTGDYSKSFHVPSSKRNNKIFKHWYNASIDNGFDARTRVTGTIDIDGVPFKTGKWLLRGVKMIKGRPDSYEINFFGDTASLTETSGNDTLQDLDLSAFNHDYDAPNVTTGLTEGLFDNSIIYTPLAQKNYFYSVNSSQGDFPTGATEAEDTPKIESYNIGWNFSTNGTGMRWTDLRPSIKLLDIVEAIETRYNGTYQKTVLTITKTGTSTGLTKIYLNGVGTSIFISIGSSTGVATQIASAVNSISGYSATSSSVYVTIYSETKGRELATQFDTQSVTGLIVSSRTTFGTKDYGFSFSRDFFGTTEFERAYMWLNAETQPKAIGNSQTLVDWTNRDINNTQTDLTTDISVLNNIDEKLATKWEIEYIVTPVDSTVPYAIRILDEEQEENGGLISTTTTRTGNHTLYQTIEMEDYVIIDPANPTTGIDLLYLPANIKFEVISTSPLDYTATLNLRYINEDGDETFNTNASASNQSVYSGVECAKLLPDMKISDFLKSMFQMFKLVVIGNSSNHFYINTLDTFYSQGDRFDISNYVDRDTIQVDRGEIISELSFNFAEPTAKGGLQFLENQGISYGDSNVKLRTPDGEDLDGDSLEVKLPYENIVYNRLTDYDTGERTDIQVGTILDLDNNAVLNEPLIHYATLVDISNVSSHVKFRGATGSQRLDWDMWMPFSHFGINEPMYSLLYQSEISTYTYSKINNTLYSRHYQDYIQAIYNIKRRTTKVTAKLPIQMITRLSLNDVITIDQLDYRINKYSYNLLNGLTKLELINGFEKYNVTDLYIPKVMTVGLNEETLYFNIPNFSNYTVSKVALGAGTNWVATSNYGSEDNLIEIVIDEWVATGGGGAKSSSSTSPYRYMKLLIINNTTLEQTEIRIQQTPNNI